MQKTFFSLGLFLAIFFNCSCPAAEDHFFLISVPRSGSHLIQKCLSKLSNKRGQFITLSHLQTTSLEKSLTSPDVFYRAHFIQRNIINKSFTIPNIKYIFHVRDLRDVTIATTHAYIKHQSIPFKRKSDLHKTWQDLPFQEKLSSLFMPQKWGESSFLQDNLPIKEFLHCFNHPNVYVSYFEKLVGPKGGGNLETQIQEILNIAQFLEIPTTREEALKIAQKLFGGTATFRKGQIGEWKPIFNKENKTFF